jgi:hypothetical protein
MFCPNCGHVMKEKDAFCAGCGLPMAEVDFDSQTPPPGAYPPPAQPATFQTPQVAQNPWPAGYERTVHKPNYLVSKILTAVGVLIIVCFFLMFIDQYGIPVTGFNLVSNSFGYFSTAMNFTGNYTGIDIRTITQKLVIEGVLMLTLIVVPISGLLTLLSFTNSRKAVTAVLIGSVAGLAVMMVFTIAHAIISVQLESYVVITGIETFQAPFWICLAGEFAIMLGSVADLARNKPVKH